LFLNLIQRHPIEAFIGTSLIASNATIPVPRTVQSAEIFDEFWQDMKHIFGPISLSRNLYF